MQLKTRNLASSQVETWMGRDIVVPSRPGKWSKWTGFEIGEAAFGGYVAGIMDTTKSNIIAADAFQTGLRYMLIVSPKSLEVSGKLWKTATTAGPAGVRTRWNGLGSTAAMVAAGASTYPAAAYCDGLSYPADGHSKWYLPAMDELELIWRNLKPVTNDNWATDGASDVGSFPLNGAAREHGLNPSSDPAGAKYTAANPAQTSVVLFKSGGAQAMDFGSSIYWSSTEYDASFAWYQDYVTSLPGYQDTGNKTYIGYVRPVRRVVL